MKFPKLIRKKSKTPAPPDLPPPVHRHRSDEGSVDEYEKISRANSKVLGMLGVSDNAGTSAGSSTSSRSLPGLTPDTSNGPTATPTGSKRGSNKRPSSLSNLLGTQRSAATSSGSEEEKGSDKRISVAQILGTQRRKSPLGVLGSKKTLTEVPENAEVDGGEVETGIGSTSRSGAGSRASMTRRSQLDHTQLLFETDFEDMVMRERLKDWASSFRRTDPRFMIMKFFNDVAISGASDVEAGTEIVRSELMSPLLAAFRRSAVFSVWRPTSIEAIRKMMLRRGTGKGLNIKGKSAKGGALSGYVPFVQIHDTKHKMSIKPLPKDATIRIFYRKREVREAALKHIRSVSEEMAAGVEEAKQVLAGELEGDHCDEEEAKRRMAWWDADDLSVSLIDTYADNKGWGPFAKGFGFEISERLFWEAFVARQDITRESGSEHDTGRKSEPAYQDMNFGSTRTWKEGDPRTVVWQHADPKQGQSPMDPRTLLIAYEENNIVLPVVSDFDCFLVGTRGVTFESPLPDEQLEIMKWCVRNIDRVLDEPSDDPWSKRWLDVLKNDKPTGKGAKIPRFGYGDPKSYSIMEYAVGRLGENGAVRHGAECFNFYFPQDLDDEFLVILGDADSGKVPWMYVTEPELRELLCQRIDRGFTFPINPKWILADPGWKEVYDKLSASQRDNVQDSLNCWYPPSSGLREQIEEIYERHPRGFHRRCSSADLPELPENRNSVRLSLTEAMELDLELELEQMRLDEEDCDSSAGPQDKLSHANTT